MHHKKVTTKVFCPFFIEKLNYRTGNIKIPQAMTSGLFLGNTILFITITFPSHVICPGEGELSSSAGRVGRGLVAGTVLIVLLAVAILVVLVYKGRKRRLRKSKYLNFGSASYSREHLPTNEFHLESPLTMSSMGYTVLA